MAVFIDERRNQHTRLTDLVFEQSGGRARWTMSPRGVAVGMRGRLVDWGGGRPVVSLPCVVECVDPVDGDDQRVTVTALVGPAVNAGKTYTRRAAGEPGPPLQAGE
jgi:hypothetical protein